MSPIPAAANLAGLAREVFEGGCPDTAMAAARRVLVDTIGCMLAGGGDCVVQALAVGWGGAHGGGPSAILGTTERADAFTAAMVGGTAAVWHDYDCGNRFLGGHPAAHLVPAALALSATTRVPGCDLLAALVAGYEVAAQVRHAVHLNPALHPHGTWPVVGVAAASALLLGLGDAELAAAIEIAGSMSLVTSFRAALAGATVRNLYAGIGAAAGLAAARAAGAGMSGLAGGMDDIFGVLLAAAGPTPSGPSSKARNIFEIERSYFKGHACARYLHSALDALDIALDGRRTDPDAVERVKVHTYGFAASMSDPAPHRELGARFSMPYTIAAALTLGETGIDAFAGHNLCNPAIAAMAAKVEVCEDPLYSAAVPAERPARVEVVTARGNLQAEVRLPRGEPDYEPFSDDQLREKFRVTAGRVLTTPKVEDAFTALWEVGTVGDFSKILAILDPSST